jgi:hypothetical protein
MKRNIVKGLGFVLGLIFSYQAYPATPTSTVTITVRPPVVVANWSCNPNSKSIDDTTPAGTVVSVCTVSMSDGSVFPGHLIACKVALVNNQCNDVNPAFIMSGLSLVTARALTTADDTPVGSPTVMTVFIGP